MHDGLYPFQKEGAYWLADNEHPNLLLGDEMGLGKTLQAIGGSDLIGARRILVICPGIARRNWEREYSKWQTIPRTVGGLYGWDDEITTDVVITSYSLITAKKIRRRLVKVKWDLIVNDEAHYLKERTSFRTKCCYLANFQGIIGLKWRTKRFWLLSGTPIPNALNEMWTHTIALFPKAAVGLEKYKDWEEWFCKHRQGEYGPVIAGSQNKEDFVKRIRPYVLRRTMAKIYPEMPALRVESIVLLPDKLPPQPPEIAELEQVLRAALAASAKGKRTEAEEEAIRQAKTMHSASLRRYTGMCKAPAVVEQLNTDFENGLDCIVVFAVHTAVIDILHTGIPGSAVIDGRTSEKQSNRLIDIFQGRVKQSAGEVPLRCLIVQLDKGSTALTLTAACHCAFSETNWVPKDVAQAIGRVRRIGQYRPVLARIFSLSGSVDEQISATLARKSKDISEIDNALST